MAIHIFFFEKKLIWSRGGLDYYDQEAAFKKWKRQYIESKTIRSFYRLM